MSKSLSISLGGAVLGAFLAYHVFLWAFKQGFYAMIVPGVFIGFGAALGRCQLMAIPVLTAVSALSLSLYLEWKTRPFTADPSLGYFLANLGKLTPVTLIMIGVGTLLAFWIPFRARPRISGIPAN